MSGIRGLRICSFSGPEYRLVVNGRETHFEMSEMFGPTFLRKRDDIPLANQNPGKAFWDAFEAWGKQGSRVGDDGYCIWEPLPPAPKPILRHLGGRNWQIMGYETPEVPR